MFFEGHTKILKDIHMYNINIYTIILYYNIFGYYKHIYIFITQYIYHPQLSTAVPSCLPIMRRDKSASHTCQALE